MVHLELRDHPDIESALRTGYGLYHQPEDYTCEICNDELNFNECYEDEDHDCLCEFCLCKLHRKAWRS